MTLTREELHQLDLLFGKICFGAKDCESCPMGFTPPRGNTMCLKDRILGRLKTRIKLKEDEEHEQNRPLCNCF